MTAELRNAGIEVNHKRVERVMRVNGIVGVHLRKPVRTTVPDPYAAPVPDLIRRDFTASAPNTKYVGDIEGGENTYLPVGDGEFLYLATVLDLHSRRLAGWSIAEGGGGTTCARSWSPTRCVRPPPVVAPPVSMGQLEFVEQPAGTSTPDGRDVGNQTWSRVRFDIVLAPADV